MPMYCLPFLPLQVMGIELTSTPKIGHPQFPSRARIERAKFAVDGGADEDQSAGGHDRSTVGGGCSCLRNA